MSTGEHKPADAPLGWHPSYDVLLATVGCPVCGAPAGYDCAVPPDGEYERDIHVARIRLAPECTPENPCSYCPPDGDTGRAKCTPENLCPTCRGVSDEPCGARFRRNFFGGTHVEDYLIRELTDPDSPEFAGRSHDERSQRARSIALMALTGMKPQTREELEALRAYLEEGEPS